jgi:hypothetical protein
MGHSATSSWRRGKGTSASRALSRRWRVCLGGARGYRFFCLLFCLAFARFGALDGRPSRRLRAWAFRRSSSCFGGVGFGRFRPTMSPSVERPTLEYKPLNKRSTRRRSASIAYGGRAFCVGPLQYACAAACSVMLRNVCWSSRSRSSAACVSSCRAGRETARGRGPSATYPRPRLGLPSAQRGDQRRHRLLVPIFASANGHHPDPEMRRSRAHPRRCSCAA